jgi:ankyrin repeat protein
MNACHVFLSLFFVFAQTTFVSGMRKPAKSGYGELASIYHNQTFNKRYKKAMIETLLQCDLSIDAPDQDRSTLLMTVASRDDLDMTAFVIENGANVNAINNDGQSPLSRAAGNGHPRIVQLLLQHGASPFSGT